MDPSRYDPENQQQGGPLVQSSGVHQRIEPPPADHRHRWPGRPGSGSTRQRPAGDPARFGVDIWPCDKDGVYSGYNQPGGSTVGQTFCRGIQLSDSEGVVRFISIYPGWYPGRITHIHFQLFLNNGLVATSRIAFPEDITHAVHATSLYSAHGRNPSVASNSANMVFSDGYASELCTLTANQTTGGYDATLLVGIAASGTHTSPTATRTRTATRTPTRTVTRTPGTPDFGASRCFWGALRCFWELRVVFWALRAGSLAGVPD